MTIIHQENMNDATAISAKSAVHCVAANEIDGNFNALPVLPVCQQAPS